MLAAAEMQANVDGAPLAKVFPKRPSIRREYAGISTIRRRTNLRGLSSSEIMDSAAVFLSVVYDVSGETLGFDVRDG